MVYKNPIFKMKNKIVVECAPNVVIKKEKKKERNIFVDILKDYCSTATIHGIGYLGANDKSIPEKIWWVVMFLLSLSACCYLISKTWIKWQMNPVILSFEKEQIPISDIPFPAVTVCPLNKVEQSKYNYTKVFPNRNNLTEEESKIFWDISLVCDLHQYDEDIPCPFNTTDEEAIDTIRRFAPSLNDTFGGLKWQNKWQDVTIFAEQVTEDGLCFTFNSFRQEDMYTNEVDGNIQYISDGFKMSGWNLELGYWTKNNEPRRAVKDGNIAGLTIGLFNFAVDEDYVCGTAVSGYKIILHNPVETPKTSQQYFLVPLNRKITMIVRPELTTTSSNLKSVSAKTRRCYFSEERSLRFFAVYTQNNCQTECDANVTKQYCGCVPFYMPRDNETTICGFSMLDCVREAQTTILDLAISESDPLANLSEYERERMELTKEIVDQCECLPACSSLHYTSETSQTENHMVKSLLHSGFADFLDDEYVRSRESFMNGALTASQVDIFFKESQFLALSRSELYGQTDFLANCGGLLGLFMGVSILSLLEIVYFLTLRLWFTYRKRQKSKQRQ